MMTDAAYHRLGRTCVKRQNDLRQAGEMAVEAFFKMPALSVNIKNISHVSEPVFIPLFCQNLLTESRHKNYFIRTVLWKTPLSTILWNRSVTPMLLTTEKCQNINDMIASAERELTLFKASPLYRLTIRTHQEWDRETGRRYQVLFDKAFDNLEKTVCPHTHPFPSSDTKNEIKKLLFKIACYATIKDSFGCTVQLEMNPAQLKRIQSGIAEKIPDLSVPFQKACVKIRSHESPLSIISNYYKKGLDRS